MLPKFGLKSFFENWPKEERSRGSRQEPEKDETTAEAEPELEPQPGHNVIKLFTADFYEYS